MKRAPKQVPFGGLEGIRLGFARAKPYGAAAVEPAAVDSPPDCPIGSFESLLRECHTNKKTTRMGGFFIGGLEGIRTLDPHNANVVRSQLRYKPV